MQGTGYPAADACRRAVHGGAKDWFLPGRDELRQMYEQRDLIGGFATDGYWSSSGSDERFAWAHGFGDGYQNTYRRDRDLSVRAIRRC